MLHSETLRKAIENLIDAKLVDAMARPDGLSRLLAHRRTGVAAPDIRNAERRLEETLDELLSFFAEHASGTGCLNLGVRNSAEKPEFRINSGDGLTGRPTCS